MRRTFVTALAALSLAVAPAALADPDADPDADGATADEPAPEIVVNDEGLVEDQRYGILEPDAEVLGNVPEPVVVPDATSLPAPQPGAEVFNRPSDGVFDVVGGGFGHGIGMSQYGADGAGQEGLNHKQILDFYYPGTNLETRSTGTIRIGITIDNDGYTRVDDRTGLKISHAPGDTLHNAPSGYSQWRVHATGGSAGSCVLEGKNSSGNWVQKWPSGMSSQCPVTFSSPSEDTVDLYLPSGERRVYRGALTATHDGSEVITVNHLPMQQYLRSVVNTEMPHYFHAQALRVQAVAARTYALRGSGGTDDYDTCDTTYCQAYSGRGVRNSDGTIDSHEHPNADAAVEATNGQVLTFTFADGVTRLATTMYSSSTGGWTTTGGAGHDYLAAHADPYDAVEGNARNSWTAQLPASSLEARYDIHRVERVQILTRDGHGKWGGRVLTARVEGFTSGGQYVYAAASGGGLQMARPWPYWNEGLSSNYFTITSGGQPPSGEPERVAGANRYGTAAQVAKAWSPGVSVVYVVSGQDYPDALAAATRAGVYDAPVLLVRRDHIPAETDDALDRLNPQRITVIGGTDAVSAGVANALKGYATTGTLERVSGTNRYGTAAALAAYYPTGRARVYLASGQDFPDALAVAALAGDQHAPLLLTRRGSLDAATVEALERLDAGEVVVLGGTAAISKKVAQQAATHTRGGTYTRLAGDDRYETAQAIAARFPAGSSPAHLASGQEFPDAMVGAALAGRRSTPMLLTRADRVPDATAAALQRQGPAQMVVFGGSAVVHDSTLEELGEFLP